MLLAGRMVAFSTKDKKKKNSPDECMLRGSDQNRSQAARTQENFLQESFSSIYHFPLWKTFPHSTLDALIFIMGLSL